MPVIRVYTGPSTYKELDLDNYYVKNTNFKLNQLTDVSFQNLSGGQMMIFAPEAGGKWVNFTPNFASRSHTHSADDVDLDNYYTKTEIDAMIGDIETLLEGI